MRIKYNVKGAHEPIQITMTRNLSPLVLVKYCTRKATVNESWKNHIKSTARGEQSVKKASVVLRRRKNQEYHNVKSWKYKDIVYTCTAITKCSGRAKENTRNYRTKKWQWDIMQRDKTSDGCLDLFGIQKRIRLKKWKRLDSIGW